MSLLGYTGKTVFVYGMGKNGLAVADALVEDNAKVLCFDTQGEESVKHSAQGQSLLDDEKLTFVKVEDVDVSTLAAVFKAPGIPMDDTFVVKAKDAGVAIKGDVDLLYKREPDAQFVAITGTNGKSTTTALIGHILKNAGLDVATGGNLGTACLALPTGKDIYVLELSPYQLELMEEAVMDSAILLNLTPDHLARHGDMQGYLGVKMKIFDRQTTGHVRVMGVDNDILAHASENLMSPDVTRVTVEGNTAEIVVDNAGILTVGGESVADMHVFDHLPGRHNWQNIACAYAALDGMVTREQFVAGVESFKNLPHRMERVATVKGVTFYNDSKATNPDSANRALESVQNIFWILGGQPKDEGITPCLEHIANVQEAFTLGACEQEFAAELAPHVKTKPCGTLENAVTEAWKAVQKSGLPKATILLSPACASWDQFDSFEHRGDVFISQCQDIISHLNESEAN